MPARHWKPPLLTAVTCAVLVWPPLADPLNAQVRVRPSRDSARQGVFGRQVPRGFQEPVFARGCADGYQRGFEDGRGRNRYDPVGSRAYRNGDQGCYNSYGARDAYKNNYRAGFRQGYEDGYRDRTR